MENKDLRFDHTDKKVLSLAQRTLPDIPHLVSVPTTNPYLKNFKYENLNTPFEDWEVRNLQYMTLVASGDRGVAWVEGDWLDKIRANSPNSGPRSGTATPYSERDPSKPRVKMSLADYKAGKRPTSSSQQPRQTLSQPTDASQASTTVPRGRSVSPTQRLIDQIVAESQDKERAVQPPASKNVKTTLLPNHTISKLENQAGRGSATRPPTVRPPNVQQERPLQLSNAPSLPQKVSPHPKRALDTVDPRPEKRVKVNHQQPLKAHDSPPPKPTPTSSVTKQSNSSIKAPAKSATSTSSLKDPKQAKTSTTTKEKMQAQATSQDGNTTAANTRMPPLLSPLPAGLNSPDRQTEPAAGRHAKGVNRNQNSPSDSPKVKGHEPEPSGMDHDVKTTSSSEDLDVMPPLLSPLPDWILEQVAREKEEMAREMAEKSREEDLASTSNTHTVVARHERSRQPDAPGVARKTTKTQSAQPVSNAEASTSGPVKHAQNTQGSSDRAGTARLNKERKIIKLKYGKRNAKMITRILAFKPRPNTESKPRQPVVPTPSGTESKKYPRSTDDDDQVSSKRPKGPANTETQRARTPLTPASHSPAPSGPSTAQKASFGTPKKGDAMKSVAMLKADSSDGRVQTPHGDFTSAPASAEKLKPNGTHNPKLAEIESLKATNQKYVSLGTTLKRNADAILKSKDPSRPAVSDEDKRHGTVVALESVVAYMVGFNAYDSSRQLEHKISGGENWTTFFPFLNFTTDRTKPYEELHTLALLLTAVSREALERLYTGRLITEQGATSGELVKEFGKNAIARQSAWQHYGEQSKLYPIQFALTVDEVKNVAVTTLADFCKKMDIAWEKKLDF